MCLGLIKEIYLYHVLGELFPKSLKHITPTLAPKIILLHVKMTEGEILDVSGTPDFTLETS